MRRQGGGRGRCRGHPRRLAPARAPSPGRPGGPGPGGYSGAGPGPGRGSWALGGVEKDWAQGVGVACGVGVLSVRGRRMARVEERRTRRHATAPPAAGWLRVAGARRRRAQGRLEVVSKTPVRPSARPSARPGALVRLGRVEGGGASQMSSKCASLPPSIHPPLPVFALPTPPSRRRPQSLCRL